MTQADLAEAMSKRGWAFHQQTVLKVEKGTRPLKLAEALSVAEILYVPPWRLWDEPDLVDSATVVDQHRRALETLFVELAHMVDRYEEARRQLATVLELYRSRLSSTDLRDAEDALNTDLATALLGHRHEDFEDDDGG